MSTLLSDQHLLAELKELLAFAPPHKLRRSLTDLFFHCMTTSETPELPNHEELVLHVYYLINFLEEVSETMGERAGAPSDFQGSGR